MLVGPKSGRDHPPLILITQLQLRLSRKRDNCAIHSIHFATLGISFSVFTDPELLIPSRTVAFEDQNWSKLAPDLEQNCREGLRAVGQHKHTARCIRKNLIQYFMTQCQSRAFKRASCAFQRLLSRFGQKPYLPAPRPGRADAKKRLRRRLQSVNFRLTPFYSYTTAFSGSHFTARTFNPSLLTETVLST